MVVLTLLLLAGKALYARTQQLPLPPPPLVAPSAADTTGYDDLVIDNEEVHEGDVILYSGDLAVEAGSVINGSLLIYSGDITLEEETLVNGDIVGFSGDAEIAGHVTGDVVIWSGDIVLEDGALVEGDLSVMNGDIERKDGATVVGNIVSAPKWPAILQENFFDEFSLPPLVPGSTALMEGLPQPPTPDSETVTAGSATQDGASTRNMNLLTRFVLRLVAAAFITGIVVFITGLTYYLQPTFIGNIQATLTQQRPVGFLVGLGINLLLVGFMSLALSSQSLFLAICLAPLSLLALMLFLIVNTGGWAALSLIVGARIFAWVNTTVSQPLVTLLFGATTITGALTFVWALGGCMRPIAYLAMLALLGLSSGALVVQQFHKLRQNGQTGQSAPA